MILVKLAERKKAGFGPSRVLQKVAEGWYETVFRMPSFRIKSSQLQICALLPMQAKVADVGSHIENASKFVTKDRGKMTARRRNTALQDVSSRSRGSFVRISSYQGNVRLHESRGPAIKRRVARGGESSGTLWHNASNPLAEANFTALSILARFAWCCRMRNRQIWLLPSATITAAVQVRYRVEAMTIRPFKS